MEAAEAGSRIRRQGHVDPWNPDRLTADREPGNVGTDPHPGHRTSGPSGPAALGQQSPARGDDALVAVLHPFPSIATAAVALAVALIFRMPVGPRLWLMFFTMLMAQFSIGVLNDWADRSADARAGRPRPVASGRISPNVAFGMATAFGLLGIGGAAIFGLRSVLLVLVGLAAGWAYDLFLKPTVLSFVPFAIAFPLLALWVAEVAGRPLPMAWLIPLGGVPLAIAIHLADAIPDRGYDAEAGLRTLPVVLGFPRTEVLAGLLLVVGVVITYWAVWRIGQFPWPLFGPLVLVVLYFANALPRTLRDLALRRQVAKFCLIADAACCGVILSLVASHG